MIELKNVSKSFGEIQAVQQVSLKIAKGHVFGLLGSNGAGKSTLLRMMAGILKQDSGEILIDDTPIFDCLEMKQRIFYLSDDPYYFPNATLRTMKEFYMNLYPNFDREGFEFLLQQFHLEEMRKIHTFSKGMKRQAWILAAICANTAYILCDEVFDGLDPVVAKVVKDIVKKEMQTRNLTVVLASHNLRELEDLCDTVGIIHKGGMLLSSEIKEAAKDSYKIQCVFEQDEQQFLQEHLDIVQYEKVGIFVTLVARGKKEEILNVICKKNPICYEVIPLSLQEIFMCEMEGKAYDISKVIF